MINPTGKATVKMNTKAPVVVREAISSDSEAMRALLNEIVDIGGSTAIEFPLSAAAFNSSFLFGSHFICCYVAENESGQALGFQSLTRHPDLPADWGDIATFARANPKVPGVGTALFQKTLAHAQRIGLEAINATIRADNVSGLSYYAKMGFVDYSVERAVPLSDGTPVDRISKKRTIARQ